MDKIQSSGNAWQPGYGGPSSRAVFTIVSKNYLHFARTLMQSVRAAHPEWKRYVLLVDEIDGDVDPAAEPFELVQISQLPLPERRRFCFRYTILELNTAVKPWMFEWLFRQQRVDHAVYLDPDIFVYHPLIEVETALQAGAMMVLTPHLTGPLHDDLCPNELDILKAGSFNLGFIAVSRRAGAFGFLDWWKSKLEFNCVVEQDAGLFVDQRWLDLAPGMFDRVEILRNEGYNVAYWNLAHRQVACRDDRYFINGKPLVFFHFSGLNPRSPESLSKYQNRFRPPDLGAVRELLLAYCGRLAANGLEMSSRYRYAFGSFGNGSTIPDCIRQMYRWDKEYQSAAGNNPFELTTEYLNGALDTPRSEACPLTRLMRHVWNIRRDLQQAYPGLLDEDRERFAVWFVDHGAAEMGIPDECIAPARAYFSAGRRSARPRAEPNRALPQYGLSPLEELLRLDHAEFLAEAYRVILQRSPDAEGFQYYLNLLRRGKSRIAILGNLQDSPEGQEKRAARELAIKSKAPAVLLISHDARRAGAQCCLLELAHALKNELGRHVELATCGDGELFAQFESIAPVARLHGNGSDIRAAANGLVSDFRIRHPDGLIVANTAAIAGVYQALEDQGVRNALAWIHELPASIDRDHGGKETIALIERVAQRIVVPCTLARDAIVSRYDVSVAKVVTMPNGIAESIVRGADDVNRDLARQSLRTLIGARRESLVVFGCGIPESRKGVDLFAIVAANVCTRAAGLPVHFVWLGEEIEPAIRVMARHTMETAGCAGRLHFIGSSEAPALLYAGVDLVIITSRLDPSPLVYAEAAIFGLPVIFFEDSGGVGEQQPHDVDLGVAGFDTCSMADRVLELVHDQGRRRELGAILREHALRSVSWKQFAERLDALCPRRVPDAPATTHLILREHPARMTTVPPERRILLILPDIEIGGGQLNAIRLANVLTATHQVFMVNARPEQYDPSVAQLISPDVIPLEGSLDRTRWYDDGDPWRRSSNNTDERRQRVRVVAELIKHFQIAIVLSQVWWSDRFALALRELTHFAWFVKSCGCYEALLHAPQMDPSFTDMAPRIMRLVSGVTYGADSQLHLFDNGWLPRPRAMRQVYNGFSRDLIDRQARQSPDRSPSDFVFCICSRAIKEKGWAEAIAAVSQINQRPAADRGGKRARLWLIGDGPALASLKTQHAANADVVFLGRRSHPHSIMAAADAGLLPSYAVGESQPTTVIESLACDRPVVATAMGAIPQMLAHGSAIAGIVVPMLEPHRGIDIQALASAMLRYMIDEETYREHKSAAAKVFDARFDMSMTLRNYVAFFEEARV